MRFIAIGTKTIVGILISADYLEMEKLVEYCLGYMKQHLNEILRLNINFSCLNSKLASSLASLFTDEEMELIVDKKDKLLSRLYRKKLKMMLIKKDNILMRCSLCDRVYPSGHGIWMYCPKAKSSVDFHGKLKKFHSPDMDWDINRFLRLLMHRKVSRPLKWREMYWMMWGVVNSLYCTKCEANFPLIEYEHCSLHKEKATFAKDGSGT